MLHTCVRACVRACVLGSILPLGDYRVSECMDPTFGRGGAWGRGMSLSHVSTHVSTRCGSGFPLYIPGVGADR